MRIFLSIILFSFLFTSVNGQTVKELEEQRKNALKMLETTSKVLGETRKNQRTSLNKLNILNKSIQQRTVLIRNIDREIYMLDREMENLREETRKLEKQLATLKAEYARMVQEAYINRSVYAKIMFVLSAETFDQSFRRLRYLQEYTNYQKMQVKQIEATKAEIAAKAEELVHHKQTKIDVKGQQEVESKKLAEDQKKENSVLKDLKGKEKTLRSEIQKHQKIANDLNRKIENLIAEEIRKAEERRKAAERAAAERAAIERAAAEKAAAEKAKSQQKKSTEPKSGEKPPTTTTTPKPATTTPPPPKPVTTPTAMEELTREESLISGNFAANAGRLPWPVEKGFISGRFGVQQHPVLKYVTTNNKGLYFQSPARSNARAVFDGVVTQRFAVPGSNNGVIIQHGQYRTVYANLTEIYVSVGEKVNAKQNIGRIYTDTEKDNQTELFFQIWKDRTILNPEGWIAR